MTSLVPGTVRGHSSWADLQCRHRPTLANIQSEDEEDWLSDLFKLKDMQLAIPDLWSSCRLIEFVNLSKYGKSSWSCTETSKNCPTFFRNGSHINGSSDKLHDNCLDLQFCQVDHASIYGFLNNTSQGYTFLLKLKLFANFMWYRPTKLWCSLS